MKNYHFLTASKRTDKEKILILIDGWRYNRYFYSILKRFIPKEYGYLHYSYPEEMLSPDPIETKQNILQLTTAVSKDINDLLSRKARSVYLYGQSLGGLFCMIIADNINIKKAMLVVPGCNLAESFWLGDHTQKIKNRMIKNHTISLSELKEYWEEISPDFYSKDKSLNAHFSIILSTKDKAIPISDGKRLIERLKEKNIPFDLSWSTVSHRKTLLKELLFAKNFRRWVKGSL